MSSKPLASLEASLQVGVRVFKDKAGLVVADCPALSLATQGRSEKQALDRMQTALIAFVHSCIQRGVMDQVLLDLGWKLHPRLTYTRPIERGERVLRVPIPVELLTEPRVPLHG
jgi:hypothetical protein